MLGGEGAREPRGRRVVEVPLDGAPMASAIGPGMTVEEAVGVEVFVVRRRTGGLTLCERRAPWPAGDMQTGLEPGRRVPGIALA